jgi:glycosyltransferase involved in cell wall biosynthesis
MPPSDSNPTLSIICPAYNEQGAIADAVADVVRDVFAVVPDAELIVVDDGSRDRTGEILDTLAASEPRLRVVHKPNGGHGPALRTGLDAAKGSWLMLIDSDRQLPLSNFRALWAAAQAGDGAFAIRQHRDDPRLRLILTRIIRHSLTLLFGVRLRDANVPFKVFRRELWLEAAPLIPADTLAPSLFLAVFAASRDRRIATIEIPHRARETGVVSIRRWKLIKFCWKAFGQLLAFRRACLAAPR